MPTAT